MKNQNYQEFRSYGSPITLEEQISDNGENNSDEFANDNNELLDRALSMINKLSSICARAANINPATVSDANEYLNDPNLFDSFVQHVEAGIEFEEISRAEEVKQKQSRSPNAKSDQRLSPDTYIFIKQVQNQIVSLKNTLHNDHLQLLQTLFAESESESLLSDQSSIIDQ